MVPLTLRPLTPLDRLLRLAPGAEPWLRSGYGMPWATELPRLPLATVCRPECCRLLRTAADLGGPGPV